MGALEEKVAVITGGNSGIGLATAQRFVKEGAYVFITGRRESELNKAVSLIGKNVTAVQADVSKLEDLDRLYETVGKVKGRLDIIFANAGVVDPVSLSDSTPETYDKHFDLNARGVYFTVQKALPLLADNGSIIISGVGRMADGHSELRPVFCDKSSFGLLCPELDRGVGQSWHSSERDQSRTD